MPPKCASLLGPWIYPPVRALELNSVPSDMDLAGVQQPYSTLGVKAAVEMQKLGMQDPHTYLQTLFHPSRGDRVPQATASLPPSPPHASRHFLEVSAWKLLPTFETKAQLVSGKCFAQIRTCYYSMPKVSLDLTDRILTLYK